MDTWKTFFGHHEVLNLAEEKKRKTQSRTGEKEKKGVFFFFLANFRLLPSAMTGSRRSSGQRTELGEEGKRGHALELWCVCVCRVYIIFKKRQRWKIKEKGKRETTQREF